MRRVDPGPDAASWRKAARTLLQDQTPPDQVIWSRESMLPGLASPALPSPRSASPTLSIPAAFMELAQSVLCHADERRWSLLYRIAWRITHGGERSLLQVASDKDVRICRKMEKSVRREIHKMHAFVRFRKAGESEAGREYYVAWYEPEHRVMELASPFFRNRFTNMDWSIFTPHGCVHWIGEELSYTEGLPENPMQTVDHWEALWKTYYASIFNPARLKLKAMQGEMPKKFWKNLPEAELIADLTRQSLHRVGEMMDTSEQAPRPIPRNQAYLEWLHALPTDESETESSG